MATTTDPPSDSYIDYETFLSPTFSPHSFANALILHTNTSDDPNLDLSTPLSRVLFDLQEIDSHIHTLTAGNATELLGYAGESRVISEQLVSGVEEQMKVVGAAYRRLEKEVIGRSKSAEEVLGVVERLSAVTRVVRGVGRVVVLGRQLEGLIADWFSSRTGGGGGEGDWKVLLRMGHVVWELRRTVDAGGDAGRELESVTTVKTVVTYLLVPAEQYLKTTVIGQLVNFALPASTASGTSASTSAASSPTTLTPFSAQKSLEATLSRVSSAIQILYLLSPPSRNSSNANTKSKLPTSSSEPPLPLLHQTLNTFLTNQTTSSLAALSRVFSSLTPANPAPPALDRSFLEIVQKIKGIVALEDILAQIPMITLDPTITTSTPVLDDDTKAERDEDEDKDHHDGDNDDDDGYDLETQSNSLLTLILTDLDTPSLPTLFFRNLSFGLETLVRNVLARGGVAARGLRAGKEKLREGLSEVVERGLVVVVGEEGGIEGGGAMGARSRKGRRRRKRKEGERKVGVGVVIGAVERGFAGK